MYMLKNNTDSIVTNLNSNRKISGSGEFDGLHLREKWSQLGSWCQSPILV